MPEMKSQFKGADFTIDTDKPFFQEFAAKTDIFGEGSRIAAFIRTDEDKKAMEDPDCHLAIDSEMIMAISSGTPTTAVLLMVDELLMCAIKRMSEEYTHSGKMMYLAAIAQFEAARKHVGIKELRQSGERK